MSAPTRTAGKGSCATDSEVATPPDLSDSVWRIAPAGRSRYKKTVRHSDTHSQLGAAALQKCHSFLTTFTGWIGKPKVVKPLSANFDDPALITRNSIAVEPKAWRERGVDVEQVLAQIGGYDIHAVASLRLMPAFGLRFKEA